MMHDDIKLKELSTQQLNTMLQEMLQQQDPDRDKIIQILEVLEEREKGNPIEPTEEAKAAWAAIEREDQKDRSGTAKYARNKLSWIIKTVAAILVIGMLLVVVPQTAGADNIFDLVARWTDTVFQFLGVSNDGRDALVFQTDHPGLQQVHDALAELGITQPVVPMWLPDGYRLKELKIDDQDHKKSACAVFSNDVDEVLLLVQSCNSPMDYQYAKDENFVRKIEIIGIPHYLMDNDGRYTVVWTTDNVECVLSSDCQEGIFVKILESVYSVEVDS